MKKPLENGKRFLIKGNEGGTSQQSLNEIFASRIHELQGYQNYVPYFLVRLPGGTLGCKCPAFTSTKEEFISAWDLVGRVGYGKDEPFRKNFINACIEGGLDEEYVLNQLSYVAITDFLLANNDRHLNNFGILRDPKTLKFTRLAPIFDSGNSMMFQSLSNLSIAGSLSERTHGFYTSYKSQMEHVSAIGIVSISKLPQAEDIEKIYSKDPVIKPFAKKLRSIFESKVMILSRMQRGISYYDATRSIAHVHVRR